MIQRSAMLSIFGSTEQVRTRPSFCDRTTPLASSTARCCITAGSEIASGLASSLTEAGPRVHLVFRDNDAGWLPSVLSRLTTPNVVRRVPRYLYESVQRVTPEMLRESVSHDPMAGSVHLVASRAYTGYELRRQALLANLRRMVERHGEAAVFPWP